MFTHIHTNAHTNAYIHTHIYKCIFPTPQSHTLTHTVLERSIKIFPVKGRVQS